MKLKSNVKLVDFLRTAQQCRGEVLYKTGEGDVLNLKSQLSQYIFLAALSAGNLSILPQGEIHCENEADYQLLANYLET